MFEDFPVFFVLGRSRNGETRWYAGRVTRGNRFTRKRLPARETVRHSASIHRMFLLLRRFKAYRVVPPDKLAADPIICSGACLRARPVIGVVCTGR